MSVRVQCPDCGDDVTVKSEAITLRPCVDDASRTSYHFVCPDCGKRVAHQCLPAIAALIIGMTDVKIVPWFVPVELFTPKAGPPIVLNDLLEFHESIDDELEGLLA